MEKDCQLVKADHEQKQKQQQQQQEHQVSEENTFFIWREYCPKRLPGRLCRRRVEEICYTNRIFGSSCFSYFTARSRGGVRVSTDWCFEDSLWSSCIWKHFENGGGKEGHVIHAGMLLVGEPAHSFWSPTAKPNVQIAFGFYFYSFWHPSCHFFRWGHVWGWERDS